MKKKRIWKPRITNEFQFVPQPKINPPKIATLIFLILLAFPLMSAFRPFFPFYNFNFGSKSLSLANAFTAVADDLSTVFWNPAGLADFTYPQVYGNYRSNSVSFTSGLPESSFPDFSQKWMGDFDARLKNVDFISISVPAVFGGTRWNFALSYYRYIPYNFNGTSAEELIPLAETSDSEKIVWDFSGENGIDVLGFSAAVYLSEYFSVGITIQYFFNSGWIRYNFRSDDMQNIQTYMENLKGQNIIIGCLFKPDKSISLGFAYHGGLKNTLDSEYSYQETSVPETVEDSCSCEIYLPPQFSLGLLVRVGEKLRLAYDFSKVLWSRGTVQGYHDQAGVLPFPVRNDFSIDQLNMVNHRLGIEFDIIAPSTIFHIRGGLFWERQLFVDAGDEPVWMKGFSLGLGIQFFSKVILDVAYMNQSAQWKETGDLIPEFQVDGHYRNHIFAISLAYVFIKKK